MPRSNAEWVDALSSPGEDYPDALQELVQHLQRSALFYLRRRLAGSSTIADDEIDALAEDSAQDAVMLVLSKLTTFRGEARFLTWAGSFSIRVAMTALRRKQWQDVSLDRVPDGWTEPAEVAVAHDGWTNPQLAAQRSAIWEVIREVVDKDLTPRQREVLNLIVINGVHTEVVEEMLGVSASSLYKMTHDARRKLKAGLLKRGYTTDQVLTSFSADG